MAPLCLVLLRLKIKSVSVCCPSPLLNLISRQRAHEWLKCKQWLCTTTVHHAYRWQQMHLLNYQASTSAAQAQSRSENQKTFLLCSPLCSSICGIHCIDVAVQLMSERQPGLGGEVDLGAPTEAPCSFTATAPGRRGGQTWLCLLCGN